jgi:hypothetical protein
MCTEKQLAMIGTQMVESYNVNIILVIMGYEFGIWRGLDGNGKCLIVYKDAG